MKPIYPDPNSIDRSHFTHQQRWIVPSKSIMYVTTEFYPKSLAYEGLRHPIPLLNFHVLPHVAILPCVLSQKFHICALFTNHKHSAQLVSLCGSLHGDHLVYPFLHYLFLKGWQIRRQNRTIPCKMMK